jgi:hypothetical protein
MNIHSIFARFDQALWDVSAKPEKPRQTIDSETLFWQTLYSI